MTFLDESLLSPLRDSEQKLRGSLLEESEDWVIMIQGLLKFLLAAMTYLMKIETELFPNEPSNIPANNQKQEPASNKYCTCFVQRGGQNVENANDVDKNYHCQRGDLCNIKACKTCHPDAETKKTEGKKPRVVGENAGTQTGEDEIRPEEPKVEKAEDKNRITIEECDRCCKPKKPSCACKDPDPFHICEGDFQKKKSEKMYELKQVLLEVFKMLLSLEAKIRYFIRSFNDYENMVKANGKRNAAAIFKHLMKPVNVPGFGKPNEQELNALPKLGGKQGLASTPVDENVELIIKRTQLYRESGQQFILEDISSIRAHKESDQQPEWLDCDDNNPQIKTSRKVFITQEEDPNHKKKKCKFLEMDQQPEEQNNFASMDQFKTVSQTETNKQVDNTQKPDSSCKKSKENTDQCFYGI